jgi:hypothetical protein
VIKRIAATLLVLVIGWPLAASAAPLAIVETTDFPTPAGASLGDIDVGSNTISGTLTVDDVDEFRIDVLAGVQIDSILFEWVGSMGLDSASSPSVFINSSIPGGNTGSGNPFLATLTSPDSYSDTISGVTVALLKTEAQIFVAAEGAQESGATYRWTITASAITTTPPPTGQVPEPGVLGLLGLGLFGLGAARRRASK